MDSKKCHRFNTGLSADEGSRTPSIDESFPVYPPTSSSVLSDFSEHGNPNSSDHVSANPVIPILPDRVNQVIPNLPDHVVANPVIPNFSDHVNYYPKLYLVECIKQNDIQGVEDMMMKFDLNKFEFPENEEPIFYALAARHIELARLLIKNNCKIDILNRAGYSPLHLCLKEDELNSLLVDILGRPLTKKDLEKPTKRGHSPLHIAVYHNNIEGIQRLLSSNVNVNPKTPNGKTPLHIACISAEIETVKTLLNNPLCLVNSQDNFNNTPLHYVFKRKDWETARQIAYLLLEKSANSEMSNRNLKKPIEESLHFGLHQLVEMARIQQDFKPMSKWKKWEIDPMSLLIDHTWSIGKGGFGEVYRGKLYGTVCAVKHIKSNENSIEKIYHEIGIMGDAHHPNLVCLLGMCKKDDIVYIITEYIDQGCLRDYLGRNTCIESMIIKMSLDITRGMAWLHSRKPPIFHRDLHTRNILVSSSGTLKLCDFGLSLVKGEVFLSNSLYRRIIPPELQASRDFSGYSAPSDVFMFGLVLYELITKQKGTNLITRGNLDDLRQRSGPTTHRLLNLVEDCIFEEPLNRPSFEVIIGRLEMIQEAHGENSGTNERSEIPLQCIDMGYK